MGRQSAADKAGSGRLFMRVAGEAPIRASIGAEEALEAVTRAFHSLGHNRVEQPPPLGFDVGAPGNEVHVKSAYISGSPVFVVKVASGFRGNADRGLPTGSGIMLVFDAGTGFPLAVLADNGYLTDLRTGAAGALAASLLAPPDVGRLGLIGSGSQARYQVRALARVRRWKSAAAWSPTRERLLAFCREMERDVGVSVEPAADAEAAVRGADLVVTTTPVQDPIVQASWLVPHATVIAVGSDGPSKRELHVDVLERADKIVVDDWGQCLRLGEVHHAVAAGILSLRDIYAELGKIVVGSKRGREGDELIVCDLTGVGAQDAAIAEVTWQRLCAGDAAEAPEPSPA